MLNYLTVLLGSFMAPKALAVLGTVLGLILGNAILGALLALKNKEFSFDKLAQFVQTSLVPYVGGLLVLALFSGSNTELSAVFFAVTAAVTAKFVANIMTKVSQLFGGLNIQIQSPISLKKSDPAPIIVTPSTETSTNTPAADKTMPAEDKTMPAEDTPAAQ